MTFSRVMRPLTIRKTGKEHLKFWIKELLSYLGISIHEWREMRRTYTSSRGAGTTWGQNVSDELTGESLESIVRSTSEMFDVYVDELDGLPESDLVKTIQFDIYELLRHLIEKENAKSFVEVG